MLGAGTETFVALAVWTFAGDGTFTQAPGGVFKGSVSGISPDPVQLSGTYTVESNCTGTLALVVPDAPFPIEYAIVIADHAKAIKAVVTSPASNIVTVELTRQ